MAELRGGFAGGAELVCGHLVARRDENGPVARAAFRGMVVAAAAFGRYRAKNRGPDYLVPYQMHAGNNMAITADLYLRCGGMPRLPSPTDRTFLNRVRRCTTAHPAAPHDGLGELDAPDPTPTACSARPGGTSTGAPDAGPRPAVTPR